ncbi:MAG: fibronectin type III domain-containing protein [Melioribacter sp.]|nr:fibronectin type III domain-containing protein [Melioribacter sp.]
MKQSLLHWLCLLIIIFICSCKKDDVPNWRDEYDYSAPELPYNPTPSDKSTNQPVDINLKWNCNDKNGHSILYEVFLGQQNPPITKIAETDFALLANAKLTFNTKYYWQIIAKRTYSKQKTVGTVWELTTEPGQQGPEPPILLSPSNGEKLLSFIPTLSWQASMGGISYILQIAKDSLFTNYVYDKNPGGFLNTTTQINNLNPSTTYWWRVNASNANGTSAWSNVWKFRIN